nr:hypothetical protein [Tanacetum cinerariifolium]
MTNSDDDENPTLNLKDDKKEEYKEEYEEKYVHTLENYEFTDNEEEFEELYKDVNMRLKDPKHEEKGKGYAKMTDAGRDDVTDTEVVSMMNVKVHHEEPSTLGPSLLTIPVTKKAQDERRRYIDLVEKSVKDIIKDEVKTQLPQILPKKVSNFVTPVIQSTIVESLENVVLAKSSSQPKSTYEAAALLTKFKLKKILLDKMQKSKSYQGATEHRELYDGLVKSYKLNKELLIRMLENLSTLDHLKHGSTKLLKQRNLLFPLTSL